MNQKTKNETRQSAARLTLIPCMAALFILGSGCSSMHARNVREGHDGDRLTVANVQSEIRRGMAGGEVIDALGSPNILTTDENGWEVWVYDRIATDVAYSRSSGSIIGLVVFGSGGGLGGGSAEGGASSTSQRTLTVVVKFDAVKQVRDFAYHSSRF
jgi:outer membrane protein assembly factor BamE (lipoprotein component of BamABCDE complex)